MSIPLCGVCRRPPRMGDTLELLRLKDGDIEAAGKLPPVGFKPACYLACSECIELLRPAIAGRLGIPVEHCVGGWLV